MKQNSNEKDEQIFEEENKRKKMQRVELEKEQIQLNNKIDSKNFIIKIRGKMKIIYQIILN